MTVTPIAFVKPESLNIGILESQRTMYDRVTVRPEVNTACNCMKRTIKIAITSMGKEIINVDDA